MHNARRIKVIPLTLNPKCGCSTKLSTMIISVWLFSTLEGWFYLLDMTTLTQLEIVHTNFITRH